MVSYLQAVTELNEAGTGTAPGLSVRDIRVHAHTRTHGLAQTHTQRRTPSLWKQHTNLDSDILFLSMFQESWTG